MKRVLKGDYIGFTFNGVHSSTLGIIRVSNGSRYNEDLLPTYQDKVVDAPGTDETYYFGSYYKQKVINISIAFDNLTEAQIRKLKQLLSDKEIHELWFDETPYKAYNVKVNGNPTLNYICFDVEQGNGYSNRIYKGEGTINFIAYYPFAHSRFKYLNDYNFNISNMLQWATTSRLKNKNNLDTVITTQNKTNILPLKRKINLWNAGDLPTDFKLNIDFDSNGFISNGLFYIEPGVGLNLSTIKRKGDDDGIQINTRLRAIQGYKINANGEKKVTSNIYNQYIISGDFFKIPLEDSFITIEDLIGGDIEIDYQYWYL